MHADASDLLTLITSEDPERRNTCLSTACAGFDAARLTAECGTLDAFRRRADNLYQRVRALLFLHALHRYEIPARATRRSARPLPVEAVRDLWERRFEAAIERLLEDQRRLGATEGNTSGLAEAYRALAFQTLADQVRRSVRSSEGNRWMFELERLEEHPLRVRDELIARSGAGRPLLLEETPVRMDLSHSGWSDIFFLGMDCPEAARVLNISIDLAVRGRDAAPRPPISCSLRVIDAPEIRLESIDLGATAVLREVAQVFDFGADHLGLLRAAVVASGVVPPALEGSDVRLRDLLERSVGPGCGLELRTHVRGIPKGSRLAVSTNLLASALALCMRATAQIDALTGELAEEDRRLVASRAILGEWLGGSGGGWQDSGGLWPGIKCIEGVASAPGDPEYGISRGRLLPRHRPLGRDVVDDRAREALRDSLVLVHGGLAQDVGPILEQVTEKYLLRSHAEWLARETAREIFDALRAALAAGDMRALARETTRNFFGPLCTIIPWATNAFTEALVARVEAEYGARYWGFWMLGGMSGGGMGLLFDPRVRDRAADRLTAIMAESKSDLAFALPFAMEPVVYDFAVNEHGSLAALHDATPASMDGRTSPAPAAPAVTGDPLEAALSEAGFDYAFHEEIRADLKAGRIGLAANRLPEATRIDDIGAADVTGAESLRSEHREAGERALAEGSAAVVVLAAGVGSRWTQGAGVVKALHPFARFAGSHRSFLDVHLAKARRHAARGRRAPGLVFTTSALTHAPLAARIASEAERHPGPLLLSRGRSVGLRLVPTERDLRFLWRESGHAKLDLQAQKLRESSRDALSAWAGSVGEASDYRDNTPSQCLHPVGHWYEVPNLLLSGALAELLREQPGLQTLLLHNVDTLGANLDAGWLGLHLCSGAALSFEVLPRHVDDRGGGLARVDGSLRLVEGLALPREEDEFRLSHYSSLTTWIDVDALLRLFGLERTDLGRSARVAEAVTALARRMPTYVTLKEVKRRFGHGQEEVLPVAQFEKLWGDMSALPEARCGYFAVPRLRGQQLKDPAQLDGWLRDGSAAFVDSLCDW